MGRRAVAATLVSAIIFTSLLVANLTVYTAVTDHLAAVDITWQEQREVAYASVLTGVSGYSALAGAQVWLASSSPACSSPQAYLGSLAGKQSMNGTSQGVDYAMTSVWRYVNAPTTETGNATIVGPFGGFVEGDLNLLVMTALNETSDGSLPSYSTETKSIVHLPVDIGGILAECSAALTNLKESLEGLSSCDSSAVASAIRDVQSRFENLSAMTLGASAHQSDATRACRVNYWVTITEDGIDGVSGTFELTLSGSSSLLLPPPAPLSR